MGEKILTKSIMHFLKTAILIVLIGIAFVVGYVRETTFIVVNTVIHNYPFPYNSSYIKPPAFLYQLDQNQLLVIKWGLTFIFSALFMGISLLIVHSYFKSKKYNLIIITLYTTLFLLSLIFALIGLIINRFDTIYFLSRWLSGLLQDPLLPLILFSLFYYLSSKQKNE